MTTNCVTFMRDLVSQGHAFLQVIYHISVSKHAISANFVVVSNILKVREYN